MSKIIDILKTTQDKLILINKSEVQIPKFEKALLNLQKKHIMSFAKNVLSYMKSNHLMDLIYNDAQKVQKDDMVEEQMKFIKSLFRQKTADEWFNQGDFEKEFGDELISAYKEVAESTFYEYGVFIEFDKTSTAISAFTKTRLNFIKDIGSENFDKFIKILHEEFYEKGKHPTVIAKKLRSSELYDEYYKGRSLNIAQTETSVVSGKASYQEHLEQNFSHKYWIAIDDGKTRDEHLINADAGKIPIDEPYPSGQMHVGDGGDPGLVCGCRCAEGYTTIDPKSDQEILLEGSILNSLASDENIEKEVFDKVGLMQSVSRYITDSEYELAILLSGKNVYSDKTFYIVRDEIKLFDLLKLVSSSIRRVLKISTKNGSDVDKRASQLMMGYNEPSGDERIEIYATDMNKYLKKYTRKNLKYTWEKEGGKYKTFINK